MARMGRVDRLLGCVIILAVVQGGRGLCDLSDVTMELTTWTGSIQSPGLDKGGYPDGQDCTWRIRVSNGSRILLNFTTFDLDTKTERDPVTHLLNRCRDYVKVQDYDNATLFFQCNISSKTTVLSTSNQVTVTFKSDETETAKGFELLYTGVCGGNVTSSVDTVELMMPDIPQLPSNDVTCEWHVTQVPYKLVVVRPSPSNSSSTLPFCSKSPVKAVEDGASEGWRELCNKDSVFVARDNFTLTYNASAGTEPWNGTLVLKFTNEVLCTAMCVHMQDCENSGPYSYSCRCQDGWVGRNCETRLTCSDGPCGNGTCLSRKRNDNFSCTCNDGFTGVYCGDSIGPTTMVDYCGVPTTLCLNDGTCTNTADNFSCTCTANYTGKRCERLLHCTSNPCSTNATCEDEEHDFSCRCPPGFSGRLCDQNLDVCAGSPCLNQGRCTSQGESVNCECQPGFHGNRCQETVDECVSQPCQHGGTCVDQHLAFTCLCSRDYRGSLCHIHKDWPHCLEETDNVFGSGIQWTDTVAGTEDVQPCPPGILGEAKRFCLEDASSPTGARWTRPDLSDCISPVMKELFHQASLELQGPGLVSGDSVLNVTSQLADVTAEVHDGKRVKLYPGDLALASTLVQVVARSLDRLDQEGPSLAALPESYTGAVDNLVDPDTHDIWQNALFSLLESRLIDLVSATETFASSYVTNMASKAHFRRKRQASPEASTLPSNDDAGGHTDPNMSTPVWEEASSPTQQPAPHPLVQVSGRNVEFQVLSLTPGYARTRGPPSLGDSNSSSISLPQKVLDIAQSGRSARSTHIFFARFTSLASLLSLKESRYDGGNSSDGRLINSDVIAGSVMGLPEHAFSSLDSPVILTFALKNTSISNKTKFCVFMNMSATDPEARWLDQGCVLKEANQSHVTCYCYHLTNFALLMDVFGTAAEFNEANNAALSYISYIGGSLSVLACLATIVVFEYFRLKSDRIRIHENLAVSIILVQAVFLIGVGRTEDKAATPEWACKTVAILLHFCLTAMFCWMLVEGIHLYLALVRVFKRGSHLKKFLALGRGVQVVVVGVSVGVFYHTYGQGKICWLNRETLLVSFIPTVGLVILINVVVLVIVIRVMMRSLHSTAKVNVQETNSLRVTLKAAVVLLPLLGLTWVLGFLAVDLGGGSLALAYVFTYAFCVANSFQGVIFFVFHCLLNVDVHTAFERRYRRKKAQSSQETTTSRLRKSSEHDPWDTSPQRRGTGSSNATEVSVIGSDDSSPHRSLNGSPYRKSDGDTYRKSTSSSHQGSQRSLRHEQAAGQFDASSDPGSAFQNGAANGSLSRRHVMYEDSPIVASAPVSRQQSSEGGSVRRVSFRHPSYYDSDSAPDTPASRREVFFPEEARGDPHSAWPDLDTGEAVDDVYIAKPNVRCDGAVPRQPWSAIEEEEDGVFAVSGARSAFTTAFAYTGPGHSRPGEDPDGLAMALASGRLASSSHSHEHDSVESSLSHQPRSRKPSVKFK